MTDPMIAALGRMASAACFFVYRLKWDAARGKFEKQPIGSPASARMTYAQARAEVDRMRATGQAATVGMWITKESGLFFLDVDGMPETHKLDDRGTRAVATFPGAFVEWSSSGRGVHVIGTLAAPIEHACRNQATNVEFYTEGRGVALNLDATPSGSLEAVHDVSALVRDWFPAKALPLPLPLPAQSTLTDDQVIEKMLSARLSAAATFGAKATPRQLWEGDCEHNSEHDAALAAHLAFWSGRNAAQVERLMMRSGMVREKWREHRTYVSATVSNACATVSSVYQPKPEAEPDSLSSVGECTDASNAARLKKRHGCELLAVEGIGWHVWHDHGPWVLDPDDAYRKATAISHVIEAEANAMDAWVNDERINGSNEQKERAKVQAKRHAWARASESQPRIAAMLVIGEKFLREKSVNMDSNPVLLGCPGGVLDLESCIFREHRRKDRITLRARIDYDPAARAPLWERFVYEVMGGDPELIVYVQTLAGYVLSGERGEQILPVLHGSGANGKSTFLGVLQYLLGDYAGSAAPDLLIQKKNQSDHPTGLASLRGKRLVIASETGEDGRLNEERVKLLTGGEIIMARKMRQDFVEFMPSHVIILQTNHKPRIYGTDTGIWRRIKLVPFAVTIPPEERDPKLRQKLDAELPGILAWCVEGWKLYQSQGFKEPAAVQAATSDYRSASDHLGTFLIESCDLGDGCTVGASELYSAYKIYCAQSGQHAMTQPTFKARMMERDGIEQKATNTGKRWVGISVKAVGQAVAVATLPNVIPLRS